MTENERASSQIPSTIQIQGDVIGGSKIEGDLVQGDQYNISVAGPSLSIPEPPQPSQPPTIPGFVGRIEALRQIDALLASRGVVLLVGLPGVGKTSLAAETARAWASTRGPLRVCWYGFQSAEQGDGALWALAALCANRGDGRLWRQLHLDRHEGARPLPLPLLLDYLAEALQQSSVLICLDDLHAVANDDRHEQLIERLLRLARSGDVRLLLCAREQPELGNLMAAPLAGLSREETLRLLEQRGLALEPRLVDRLHAVTEGNPQFLLLAAELLRQTSDAASLIERLPETQQIERYLLREVDSRLTETERTLMAALSTLLGIPGTRAAIAALLGVASTSLRRLLLDLCDRHLLNAQETAEETVYNQHALIREFYYDALGSDERQAYHLRAGNFYEQHEPDPLRAARHFERAGDAPEVRVRQARAYLRVATLLEVQSPPVALDWIERGLAAAAGLGLAEEPLLQLRRGSTLLKLGRFEAAAEALQGCLAGLPEAPSAARTSAWSMLGIVRYIDGDIGEGMRLQIRAAELARSLDEGWELAKALLNLGRMQHETGDWSQALANYAEALALAESSGNLPFRMPPLLNTANLRRDLGDLAGASAALDRAIALARDTHMLHYLAPALASRCDLELRRGDLKAAQAALDEAGALVQESGNRYSLIEIGRLRALLALAHNDAGARGLAEWALALAHEFEARDEEGMALHVLGLTLLAAGQRDAALGAFAQSVALLDERNPYEAARARADWGQALNEAGATAEGDALLAAAQTTFAQLRVVAT
jgi:tetratricopeptide (TPR) repeat protein